MTVNPKSACNHDDVYISYFCYLPNKTELWAFWAPINHKFNGNSIAFMDIIITFHLIQILICGIKNYLRAFQGVSGLFDVEMNGNWYEFNQKIFLTWLDE